MANAAKINSGLYVYVCIHWNSRVIFTVCVLAALDRCTCMNCLRQLYVCIQDREV